jgi:hypothetical protein
MPRDTRPLGRQVPHEKDGGEVPAIYYGLLIRGIMRNNRRSRPMTFRLIFITGLLPWVAAGCHREPDAQSLNARPTDFNSSMNGRVKLPPPYHYEYTIA